MRLHLTRLAPWSPEPFFDPFIHLVQLDKALVVATGIRMQFLGPLAEETSQVPVRHRPQFFQGPAEDRSSLRRIHRFPLRPAELSMPVDKISGEIIDERP